MAFFYVNERLKVGTPHTNLDLQTLGERADQPVYIYDLDQVRARVDLLKSAFAPPLPPGTRPAPLAIHYAMKANSNHVLLQALAATGIGVDTVSAGEIRLALEAGFAPATIIFSGVGKTKHEITFALKHKIKQLNIESPAELKRVIELARDMKVCADIAFRMNPDVNPQTHPYITTGFRENKFGMDESFLPELLRTVRAAPDAVRLRGLTLHIGSQLLELQSLQEAITKTITVFKSLRDQGFALDRFDIGGGLGIDYAGSDQSAEESRVRAYGGIIEPLLRPLGVEIMTEPGRLIVGRAGVLLGEVQYLKETKWKRFAILNTGMHHLLRPALYQAVHRILPLRLPSRPKLQSYDVVGPICESSDVIARTVELPELNEGDWLAIADSGAYGFSMASVYNAHVLPVEICVQQGCEVPDFRPRTA